MPGAEVDCSEDRDNASHRGLPRLQKDLSIGSFGPYPVAGQRCRCAGQRPVAFMFARKAEAMHSSVSVIK